jgi:hypothetical protein
MAVWAVPAVRPRPVSAAPAVTAATWARCRFWVRAGPVVPVARALMALTVWAGLSRVVRALTAPMAAMAAVAVMVARAVCCSAVAAPVASAVPVVRAAPVARVVPESWAPTSAIQASMVVPAATRVTVDRQGQAVMVVRRRCCSRSRAPVWPVSAVLAVQGVSAVMAVTVLTG